MTNKDWRKCVLLGDSKDIIKKIPDNAIDFILTDPPYNLASHSTGNIPLPGRSAINNDLATWDTIEFNPEEWAEEFIRILKPTGNLFIFTSYNQLGRWYNCLDKKFDSSNFMIWHKTNPAPKIFKAGFLNSCEMIFTCWNKKHTWNFLSQAEMHNFIESPICMSPERLKYPKHPTQKPVNILKKMIKIASNTDDIVFDPFMGVGSTGVAALELGRRFIGVEIDETYFKAAKERINDTNTKILMKQHVFGEEFKPSGVSEPRAAFGNTLFDFDDIFTQKEAAPIISLYTNLRPLLKWAGGKEKELKYILPNTPKFERYFEPFVGGGSVFLAIKAQEYFINDLSDELISLYKNIASNNDLFYEYIEAIDKTWINIEEFYHNNSSLFDIYIKYRKEEITKQQLRDFIRGFCKEKVEEINSILADRLRDLPSVLVKEIDTNLFRKMSRMNVLEKQKHLLPYGDIHDNIETALKSAAYMNFRNLYNDKQLAKNNPELFCALFLFIRNYSYSGMFRYNDKGEFNVPYGGIAYNSKLMSKKVRYYKSDALLERLAETKIYNLDFEQFLRATMPDENDFVFLDPPYDSEFSTYAQNEFTREDQKRLAKFMIEECKAKWMLVIKNTEFIFELYNKPGINIRSFEKNYLVSFMNRNDKKVTHLLITNY